MSEESAQQQRQTVVLLAVAVEGGMIVLAWALGWLLDQPPLQTFHWTYSGALWGAAAALPVLALFLAVARWPVGPLARVKRFSEEVIYPLLAPCSVLDLLGISVLAGLGEEMLFRAVLQGAFAHWLLTLQHGRLVALALASVLFGAMHAVTAAYAVLAALMGAYLGWLWIATDNLLAPALTHALYDFLVLLYLLRGPGVPAAPPNGDADEGTEQEAVASPEEQS
jgi:membrane protease YdiL (CAAX protease family)